MKIRWILFFMLAAMVQLAATNPEKSQSKTSSSQKSKSNNSALGPQGVVSDSIVQFFSSRKTGKELMSEKKKDKGSKEAPASQKASSESKKGSTSGSGGASSPGAVFPGMSRTSTALNVPKIPVPPRLQKIGKLSVLPPPVPRVAVPQIRQEIQRILDLNKQIKAVQGGKALQFQKVQDQARIHQKILNKIETSAGGEAGLSTSQVPNKEVFLAQEKLRLIHEETQRNAVLMEAAGGMESKTSAQDTASGSSLQFKKIDATPASANKSEPEPPIA